MNGMKSKHIESIFVNKGDNKNKIWGIFLLLYYFHFFNNIDLEQCSFCFF